MWLISFALILMLSEPMGQHCYILTLFPSSKLLICCKHFSPRLNVSKTAISAFKLVAFLRIRQSLWFLFVCFFVFKREKLKNCKVNLKYDSAICCLEKNCMDLKMINFKKKYKAEFSIFFSISKREKMVLYP